MSLVGYLLDTNVVSETRKRRPHHGLLDFLAAANANQLFISVLTIGEVYKGVEAKRAEDPAAADSLRNWLLSIETTFIRRVLPVDPAVARRWGELSARRSLPVIDTLIAATALVHGLTLVTRNIRDVSATGVDTFNPWQVG
jgi:predicted nucleic acid-binding protein